MALLWKAREYPALVREHCCGWDARERRRDGYRDIHADKSFFVYNHRWGTRTLYKLDFIEACSREGDSLES